ncbi:MAG: glycosyltransferase [Chitinophagaceae bacterium]|nr:glycosyltransferase [Chitinophagaceae bacterium]
MELVADGIKEAEVRYNDSLEGRDIVIIGLQPWYYEIGSNCKNIATYFAKNNNRVLYVDLPINRKTFLSKNKKAGIAMHCEVIKTKKDEIRQLESNMWELFPTSVIESINFLPSSSIFTAINYLNNKRFAKNIKDATRKLGFKNIILFNDNDIYNGYFLKELLQPSLYIYYFRDFLQGYDYWKKHTTVLEPKLIAKADLVVANSTYYAEYCSGYNPNSHYIGQGCKLDLFNPESSAPIPDDVRHIEKSVIGYVGALDSVRLDLKILELIARSHPEWNIILVGPEDDVFLNSSLHQINNIHFLGRKSIDLLPDYIRTFDVCINPQLQNIITRGNYPLKIDEYLAMGKPVVATRTKAMKLFEAHTFLADSPEDYPALITKALNEYNQHMRQEGIDFANSHTWENSMKALFSSINATLSTKTSI